jgi:hypothetical protein
MEVDAWPLLPRLPHLRHLRLLPDQGLTAAFTTSLTESLVRLRKLEEVNLSIYFDDDNEEEEGIINILDDQRVSAEEQQARWTDILRSLPKIRKLTVDTGSIGPLLAVLPNHLPRLEQLTLVSFESADCAASVVLSQLSHPTLQQLELEKRIYDALTAEQIDALLRCPRLPQLRRCRIAADLFVELPSFARPDFALPDFDDDDEQS